MPKRDQTARCADFIRFAVQNSTPRITLVAQNLPLEPLDL
jgi:hypothetical protein